VMGPLHGSRMAMATQVLLGARDTASLKSGQGLVRIPSARKTSSGLDITATSTTVPITVCMMLQVCFHSHQFSSTSLKSFQGRTSEI
jgi:hypothetical protein